MNKADTHPAVSGLGRWILATISTSPLPAKLVANIRAIWHRERRLPEARRFQLLQNAPHFSISITRAPGASFVPR